MTECATCKYVRKLYVPPVYKDIPTDAYVCLLFDGEAMYMSNDRGFCEMYKESEQEGQG